VLQAENGEECLDLLRDTRVDVLILDWILPGMDGVEVCKRLHSSERIKSPHIIMVTIMGGSRSKIYALDSGADDFINKPIDMDELLARVRVGMRVMNAREKIAKAEKLEGVLQMAGAVAHELSQPLTSLMGLVDLLLLQFQPSDPLHGRLCQIVNEAQRLGDLTKKIGRIVKYETRDYLGDTRIVDIDKASRRDP
jgi:DNA-binding response OmpR family regulator